MMQEVYTNRGAAKAELGQLEAAIKDYNEALCLDPDLAKAYAESRKCECKAWSV